MNKAEINILEKAFSAEIESALNGGLGILQTKSKIAEKLAEEGYLQEVQTRIPGYPPVTVKGYALTIMGNAMYCSTCR